MEDNLSVAQIFKIKVETEYINNQTKRKDEAHEWLKKNSRQKYDYKENLYGLKLQEKKIN